MLYERVAFKVRHNHFCFFGNGHKALSIPYAWLDQYDRAFMQQHVLLQRTELFKDNVTHESGHFSADGFVHDPKHVLSPLWRHRDTSESHTGICSFVWQRELVRDFAWLVMSKQPALTCELLMALQTLMVEHPLAKRDIFLGALHNGVQGTVNVYRVPCWGLSSADLHPEDAYQRKEFKHCVAEIEKIE